MENNTLVISEETAAKIKIIIKIVSIKNIPIRMKLISNISCLFYAKL